MARQRRRQFRTNFGRVHAGFLDLRSGLIIGDLQNEALPIKPLLRREMLCAIPPSLFLEKISCLAGIMGETGESGQGPGLDEKAKRRDV
jgi:hypothetical protein